MNTYEEIESKKSPMNYRVHFNKFLLIIKKYMTEKYRVFIEHPTSRHEGHTCWLPRIQKFLCYGLSSMHVSQIIEGA